MSAVTPSPPYLGLGCGTTQIPPPSYLLLRVDIFILNALEPMTASVGRYSLAVLTKLLTDSIVPVMMPEQVEASACHATAGADATVRMPTLFSCESITLMCLPPQP